jgi:hypothetical protein
LLTSCSDKKIDIMNLSLKKPDNIGAIASSMCVVHCLATPFLFVFQSYTALEQNSALLWWTNLDFLFITISVLAVYRSTLNSTNKIIKQMLWTSWFVLFVLILNEKIEWLSLPELVTYFAAIVLASLHLYNLNYCKCETENCCDNS